MELASVVLARAIGLVETGLFNPRGVVSRQHLTTLLVGRFSFASFPTKWEDTDQEKGFSFKGGYFEGQSIDELAIFSDGIKMDVRSSTENAQKIILDSLEWLKAEAGITYNAGMIPRWAYLSNIVVRTDLRLDALHPALSVLAERIGDTVNRRTGENFNYRLSGMSIDFPRLSGTFPINPFTFERRANTPDATSLYFSAAPMQTSDHVEALEEFERNMLARNEG